MSGRWGGEEPILKLNMREADLGWGGGYLHFVLDFLISLVPSLLRYLDTVQELKERALSRYSLVRVSIFQHRQLYALLLLVHKTLQTLRPFSLLAPAQNVPFPESCSDNPSLQS